MHVTLFKKYIYRKGTSSFAFVVSLLIEPIKVDVHMSCTGRYCTAKLLPICVKSHGFLLLPGGGALEVSLAFPTID